MVTEGKRMTDEERQEIIDEMRQIVSDPGNHAVIAVVTEADLQYLRNINTKPGPNAGRSIDPSKPGPDDGLPREHQDPSKFPTWETVEQAHTLAQSVFHEAHGRRSILTAIRKSIELVENEIIDEEQCFMLRTAMRKIDALAQSDAKRIAELEAECGRFENELFEARAALAQSDAKPDPDDRWPSTMDKLVEKMARAICKADGDPKDNWTEWVPHAQAALAQSDAEPVAWQIRTRLTQGKWTFWLGDGKPDLNDKVYEIRPLYTMPPTQSGSD